jgi:hypothetical protein
MTFQASFVENQEEILLLGYISIENFQYQMFGKKTIPLFCPRNYLIALAKIYESLKNLLIFLSSVCTSPGLRISKPSGRAVFPRPRTTHMKKARSRLVDNLDLGFDDHLCLWLSL